MDIPPVVTSGKSGLHLRALALAHQHPDTRRGALDQFREPPPWWHSSSAKHAASSSLQAEPDVTYELQVSTNLPTGTALSSVTPKVPSVMITNAGATYALNYGFCRAKRVQ